MIKHTKQFYTSLKDNARIKQVFYHFKSLLSIAQYELLFKYVSNKYHSEGNAKILDWGCGNGWFSYYLLNSGYKNVTSYVYGWDDIRPAMAAIKELKVVNGEDHTLNSPSQLPFSAGEYDIVFSIGVLEHVHETGGDQAVSLGEINRVLKPGGVFYCYHLPNKYTWIEYFKAKFLPVEKQAYLHTRKFNSRDIFKLLSATGFRIKKVRRYNLLPYNIFRNRPINSSLVTWIYRFFDSCLSATPLNYFCQCYLFEAEKVHDLSGSEIVSRQKN
ncbi:MAG: methyltransferase domain-containing protein [Cyclobacteriaceae bacterium]